jgi:PAS domain S-box-containing protein
MEEHLREEGYRRLIESTGGHAIFMLRPTGDIESWPSSASSLYGGEPTERIGTPFDSLWAEEDRARQSVDLASMLVNAKEDSVELNNWQRRANGEVFWAETTVSPVWNDEFHGYAVVCRDSTQRKQYERMLERQNDRLKEFTDILSHDLRTPLSVVDGRLQLYRETGEGRHLEEVEGTLARMERLIDDLLSVAREGSVVREPEPTDLHPIVEESAFGTLPDRATLVYDPVPAVMADGKRLQQVFDNLFRNAVEHVGPGVTIRVGPLADGFYVEDNGPGIPEPDRAKVFDHGFTTRDDGSGFGLSVVRTIVGSHGWDHWVVEGTDGGARFEFTGTGVLS